MRAGGGGGELPRGERLPGRVAVRLALRDCKRLFEMAERDFG